MATIESPRELFVHKLGAALKMENTIHDMLSGDVHANSIEGFFGLLKPGIRGVYHSVSKTHLQSYLDEYALRYKRRNDSTPMFWAILDRVQKSGCRFVTFFSARSNSPCVKPASIFSATSGFGGSIFIRFLATAIFIVPAGELSGSARYIGR